MPSELKDCKVYKIYNEHNDILYITRCPNSDTPTSYNFSYITR